jgi:hypothetical protein
MRRTMRGRHVALTAVIALTACGADEPDVASVSLASPVTTQPSLDITAVSSATPTTLPRPPQTEVVAPTTTTSSSITASTSAPTTSEANYVYWTSTCSDGVGDSTSAYDIYDAKVGYTEERNLYVFDAIGVGPEWFGQDWYYEFRIDDDAYTILEGRTASGGPTASVTGPGIPSDLVISEGELYADEGATSIALLESEFPLGGRQPPWSVTLYLNDVAVDGCSVDAVGTSDPHSI